MHNVHDVQLDYGDVLIIVEVLEDRYDSIKHMLKDQLDPEDVDALVSQCDHIKDLIERIDDMTGAK